MSVTESPVKPVNPHKNFATGAQGKRSSFQASLRACGYLSRFPPFLFLRVSLTLSRVSSRHFLKCLDFNSERHSFGTRLTASRERARFFMKTYYDVLEIMPLANIADIKSAYKLIAMKCHPDKDGSTKAKALFYSVSEAYQVLSSPTLRKDYDAALKAGKSASVAQNTEKIRAVRSEIDPGLIFKNVVGAIFSRSLQREEVNLAKGKKLDMHFDIIPKVNMKSKYQWRRKRVCVACRGGSSNPCPRCKNGVRSVAGKLKTCPTCHGSGVSVINDCPTCEQSGYIQELREVTFVIKPEQIGEVTRLKEEGDEALRNGYGDVVFHWRSPVGAPTTIVPPMKLPSISSAPDLQDLIEGGSVAEHVGASLPKSSILQIEARSPDKSKVRPDSPPISPPLSASPSHDPPESLSAARVRSVNVSVTLSLKEALCGNLYFPVEVPGGGKVILETQGGEVIQPGATRIYERAGPQGVDVILQFKVELPTSMTLQQRTTLSKMLPSPQRPYMDRPSLAQVNYGASEVVNFIRERRKVSHISVSEEEDSSLIRSIPPELSSI